MTVAQPNLEHESFGPFFKDASEWIPVFEEHGEKASSFDSEQLLFHYTNGDGLKGIAKSGNIWATHHEHTNDFTEVKYGLELVLREIRSRLPAPDDVNYHFEDVFRPESSLEPSHLLLELLQAMIVQKERTFDFFIACFSEEGDLLSQWRAYATNAAGYSIGYLGRDLATISQRLISEAPIQLFSVIYKADEQSKFIRAVLDLLSEIFRRRVEDIRESTLREGLDFKQACKEIVVQFNAYALKWLLAAAARIKHHGFREEREWRLVFPVNTRHPDKPELPILHRTVVGGLVPYVAIPLQSHARKIWIGPKRIELRSDVSDYAVRSLFESNDLAVPEVLPSEIPYR